MKNIKFVAITYAVLWFTAVASQAQTFNTLFSFDGADGEGPWFGSLTQGIDGSLYGTTVAGGLYNGGEVFGVTPTGMQLRSHSFCSDTPVCGNGYYPVTGPLLAANGGFYGTTVYGGANNTGTIYRITPAGNLTTVYSFAPGVGGTGGALVQGPNGDLYGSAGKTIYSFSSAGTFTTVYSFPGIQSNGLVLGWNGEFYGTTTYGGRYGNGTFFALTPGGKLTTLYNFKQSDLFGPSNLALDSNGNFYGTSSAGGANDSGTVFELTPTGKFTLLYSFCSQPNCADGASPYSSLVQGTDGNLYGTTSQGGTGSAPSCQFYCGTIFQITTSGTLTTLYNFCSQANCADGDTPYSGLVQGTDGNFYGATYSGGIGGATGAGTIFSLSMGLGPFVQANPTFGKPSRTIGILGNNLTGTNSVSFNGTPATFTVVSDTLIKATVPTGATTGTIQVTTPSGTLNSNVTFQVLP